MRSDVSLIVRQITWLQEKFDDLERRIRSTTQLMDSSTRRARRTMSTLSNAAADVVQVNRN